MTRLLVRALATVSVLATLGTSAQAWDNCGHGYHRNIWGRCHSNYGPHNGCRPGYHVGWDVYKCVPNR